MLRLYDYLPSGNGYKVRLALARLGLAYELVEVDILKGETRTPEFLRRNPIGRIPVLELEDGTPLAESNSIIWYLAEGTALAPASRRARAETLRWMFFEQYNHEPAIAVVRFWKHSLAELTELQRLDLPERVKKGYAALDVMEKALARAPFLVDGRFGLADIALYAYTHVAHEGDFDLAGYPAIRGWLARVAAEPGHVTIDQRPAPARLAG